VKKLLIAIVAAVLLSDSLSLPMHATTSDNRIIMLLSREDGIIVSTRKGLFKSKTASKRWDPVALPSGVLPGGCLYPGPRHKEALYYSPPSAPEFSPDNCIFSFFVGAGLWVSDDEGTHWTQLDKSHLFQYVFASTNGNLYAAVHEPSSIKKEGDSVFYSSGGIAMASADGGQTWRELGGRRIMDIGQCNKHSAHLCASLAGSNSGGGEYAPETGKWTFIGGGQRVVEFNPKWFPEYVMGSARGCCFTYYANLENYFLDFGGESLEKPGLNIQAGKRHYSFRGNDPRVIDVEITILPLDPPQSLRIPDIDAKEACWGLEYVDPAGKYHFVDFGEADQAPEGTPTVHVLSPAQGYKRRINLDAIEHFTQPGIYKVAMLFDNNGLERTDPEDWTGRFSGEAFEVSISP
jgi:hypothetical protein